MAGSFVRHAVLLFLALRIGDFVNVAAGVWFVPKYVSPEDIGAVLPVTSFATFLSLPVFAFAMTVMKESACLAAEGERGKVKSLLRGVFVAVAAILALVLLAAAVAMPRFLRLMRVSDGSVGFLVVAAAFLGCVAPVYTDALQSLKRFGSLAVVEVAGAVTRFAVMMATMPFRALAGYFAGQAALPLFRMAGSVVALRRDLSVPAEPYWSRAAAGRIAAAFAGIVAYQAVPMAVSLLEQSLLRTSLSSADSAGYYMVTRFADFLHYLTFPLMLVMFPYTATAAQKGGSTRPFVLKCSAAALLAAAAMMAVYALFGRELLSLMPHGSDYAPYVRYMPWLVLVNVLTTCQVFYANAEVSAGRFGFLWWFVPLHAAYAAALFAASSCGFAGTLPALVCWFGAASLLRFAFSALAVSRRILPVCAVMVTAVGAMGFVRPVAVRDGVTVRIAGFDENRDAPELQVATRDAAQPFPIQIAVENAGAVPVSGALSIALNDDWDVTGVPETELAVAAGASRTLTATARGKPGRVLPALYPIHVEYAIPGGEPIHPIAIFKATVPLEGKVAAAEGAKGAPKGRPSRRAPTDGEWELRGAQAVASAKAALADGTDAAAGRFLLDVRGERWGAAFSFGAGGVLDGVLAFTDGTRSLAYRGFACDVDGIAAAGMCGEPRVSAAGDALEVVHPVERDGRRVAVRMHAWAEKGALRLRWDMPGAVRDARGHPRYTRLGIGAGSLAAVRAYAGFGNVIENPRSFALAAGGFGLSTRHVGSDHANGASLLQAVDVFPDRLVCNREAKRFILETHHDATFTFIPSSKGAFAAARMFRDVCGYSRSPAWREAAGRMCIDMWSGPYAKAAEGLALAGKYGVREAIFVRHDWQRWGYDYRLPDILPPYGSGKDFAKMREAARDAGILFCLHDNYIDFYPDAAGFSYDLTVFNGDGTPQTAWYNTRRRARSYRWAPHLFLPWLERNAAMMRDAFEPEAIFLDVFSCRAPMDYYDREGRFYGKTRTQSEWARAFDVFRSHLAGKSGVTVSEAGNDVLVGHLDAGQSDHFGANRWMPPSSYADSERTPWHDMATHGSFVLFAGGLGHRYCAIDWKKPGDTRLHGYGSDDYLCNTVIGGRSPMCDGPFYRRTVMTYWLLHDICTSLALANLESLEYGGSIHRQHSTFSNGGEVWINRATNGAPWTVEGFCLPMYGFYAKAPCGRAGIVRKDGQRCAFAESEGRMFVDARPLCGETDGGLELNLRNAIVPFAGVRTDGAFRLEHPATGDWRLVPLPDSPPFRAEIDLSALGAAGRPVCSVEAVEPGAGASPVEWRQNGDTLHLAADARAFAYMIRFAR